MVGTKFEIRVNQSAFDRTMKVEICWNHFGTPTAFQIERVIHPLKYVKQRQKFHRNISHDVQGVSYVSDPISVSASGISCLASACGMLHLVIRMVEIL